MGNDECEYCYSTKAVECLVHSSLLKSTIRGLRYDNLQQTLYDFAGGDHSWLKKLFKMISFELNAPQSGKLQAVIAGSYPSYLAGKVKKFEDIDIFILWNPNLEYSTSIEVVHAALEYINTEREEKKAYDCSYYHNSSMDGIMRISNIGKLQFILKEYEHTCHCMFHLDRYFFRTFHHVTRWKLLVFPIKDNTGSKLWDLVVPKYISYEEERGVVTKEITINIAEDAGAGALPYPAKHKDNQLNFCPPSLYQQAFRAVMKFHHQSIRQISMFQ